MKVKLKTIYAGPRGNCAPGAVIDLPDKEAEGLIDGGCAEKFVEKPKAPPPAPVNTEVSGEERKLVIKDAVAEMLDKDDVKGGLFTADGKPTVPALGKRLGFKITTAERDAAFEELKA